MQSVLSRVGATGSAARLFVVLSASQAGVLHAASDVAPGAAPALEEMVVVGRRLSQANDAIGLDEVSNTVAVTREALLSAPAGISGLKMLEGLPGFNVQTDGALGLYEFGNSVTVRAFNLTQIGFVLDNIPMGRSDAFGGSPIFRYVDNENLGAVVASPGAGDVSLPSYASLGPIVQYRTTEPAEEFSALVSQAFGDDELNRSFVKLETGKIGGFSAYLSRSKTDSDLWRGAGSIDREHWEGKARYAFDDYTSLTFQFVYNDFYDFDSPSFNAATYESSTPDLGGKTGRDRGYIGFIPDLGFGPDVAYQNSGYTYYYLDRINLREDVLYGLTFDTAVSDNVNVSVTAYFEDKDGYGVSPEAYGSAFSRYEDQIAAGLPVTAPRGIQWGLSEVGGERTGAVAKVAWGLGNHRLEAGVWVEEDDYDRTQLRLNKEGGNPTGQVLFDEVAYFRRDYNSLRDTTQVFLKDTISLMDDKLTLEVGIKSLNIDFELSGYRDYDDYALADGSPGYGPQSVDADYSENFLPMLGAVYQVGQYDQVFASYSENFALPRGADDVFSVATSVAVPAPDGEESTNYEIGYRTSRPTFNAAAALFYTEFDNRLQSFTVPLVGSAGGVESYFQNVGAVESYGLELTGQWKPEFLAGKAYVNGNLTYNKTEFQDDYQVFDGSAPGQLRTVAVSGNELPDSPNVLVTLGLTYEPFPWLIANLTGRYLGERYSNFVNTEEMESYTVWSAYVDLGDGAEFGPFKNVKTRVNVDNVFDEDVLAFTFTSTESTAFFRPLNPRTVQVSITAEL